MIHPHTKVEFISDEVGYGLVASRHIRKGTVTWVLDDLDRLFYEEEVRRMSLPCQEILERYCFRNNRGQWVFCWDNTRYINHSFFPTCIATPYQFELAVRDIRAGEQITNDYGFFNIIEPFDCLPEPGCERTRVMPDDILRCHETWDAQLAEAFALYSGVDQPLARFMKPETLKKAEGIASGREQMDSILNCYYAETVSAGA